MEQLILLILDLSILYSSLNPVFRVPISEFMNALFVTVVVVELKKYDGAINPCCIDNSWILFTVSLLIAIFALHGTKSFIKICFWLSGSFILTFGFWSVLVNVKILST